METPDSGLPDMPTKLIKEIEVIYEMRRIADHLPSTIQKLDSLGGSVCGALSWEISQEGGKNLFCQKSGENYGNGRPNAQSNEQQIGYFPQMPVEALQFSFAGFSVDVNQLFLGVQSLIKDSEEWIDRVFPKTGKPFITFGTFMSTEFAPVGWEPKNEA